MEKISLPSDRPPTGQTTAYQDSTTVACRRHFSYNSIHTTTKFHSTYFMQTSAFSTPQDTGYSRYIYPQHKDVRIVAARNPIQRTH